MSNSITNKINDYFLAKVAKSKVQHLFMVSKEHLFTKIHELNERVYELSNANDFLSDKIDILKTELVKVKRENNTLKTQSKARTDINYKLAYESIKKQAEVLTEENKSIKDTLKIVSNVVENSKKQNNLLKEQNKILTTQNIRLEAENKNYKENKVVKHNFTAKRNNNSSKVITRQVNN